MLGPENLPPPKEKLLPDGREEFKED